MNLLTFYQWGIAVAVTAIAATNGHAQTFTSLFSFSGTNGSSPGGSLTLSGSILYGATLAGGQGVGAEGTVFSIPVSGGSATTLYSFTGGSTGILPAGGLIVSGSTIYGTSQYGASGAGVVFSMPAGGGMPTTLFSFSGSSQQNPSVSVLSGPTLYGSTYNGGAFNEGSVFSLPSTGGSAATLYSFAPAYNLTGSLILSGSTLYGTTGQIVFSMPVSGGTFTTLCTFSGSNGATPRSNLILSGSTLYGSTYTGGAYNEGTIFSVAVTGGSATTLFSFNGADGANPSHNLVLSGSTLYGSTEYGGATWNGSALSGDGTIFGMPVSGGTVMTLFSFAGGNGQNPLGLAMSGSTLFGTTSQGGNYAQGTVFALDLTATPEPSTLALLGVGVLAVGARAVQSRE
jgi:uncharacterized repeat protein (TIGR03803 family)